MDKLGNKIKEIRKSKGFSQEELADLSKVNLRTIQRIENNENEARGKTLNLICNALEIDIQELQKHNDTNEKKTIAAFVINIVYLLLLNLLLMSIIGSMTLSSDANTTSRFGGLLLSIFIPLYIVYLTRRMTDTERVLKFGVGFMAYIVMLLSTQGFENGFRAGIKSGLFICLLVAIATLFYGKIFYQEKK